MLQGRDEYFLNSGDKVAYFYEKGALGEDGTLLVEPHLALNKVGHALHEKLPVFRDVTNSERVKEVCRQLGMDTPALAQSMYIYKNPGVGGEGWFARLVCVPFSKRGLSCLVESYITPLYIGPYCLAPLR